MLIGQTTLVRRAPVSNGCQVDASIDASTELTALGVSNMFTPFTG